jgi:hypothetical protein
MVQKYVPVLYAMGSLLQRRHGCSGPRAGSGLSRNEPAQRNPCR